MGPAAAGRLLRASFSELADKGVPNRVRATIEDEEDEDWELPPPRFISHRI